MKYKDDAIVLQMICAFIYIYTSISPYLHEDTFSDKEIIIRLYLI